MRLGAILFLFSLSSNMKSDEICFGDSVSDSPVGDGVVTGFTDRGYPQVNHVAVLWLERPDGARYDPHQHKGGSRMATGGAVPTPDLVARLQHAKIAIGEQAVVDRLRARGLA